MCNQSQVCLYQLIYNSIKSDSSHQNYRLRIITTSITKPDDVRLEPKTKANDARKRPDHRLVIVISFQNDPSKINYFKSEKHSSFRHQKHELVVIFGHF